MQQRKPELAALVNRVVAFVPGDAIRVTPQGEVLVVTVPPGHALLRLFGETTAEEISIDLQ